MTLEAKLLAVPAFLCFFACIFFVAFGQVTVKKLRRNPATKEQLGLQLASGWDILNVASAICRPEWLNERYKKSQFSFLSAKSEVLIDNTTVFDRVLARLFWYTYVCSGSGLILMLILSLLGVFD